MVQAVSEASLTASCAWCMRWRTSLWDRRIPNLLIRGRRDGRLPRFGIDLHEKRAGWPGELYRRLRSISDDECANEAHGLTGERVANRELAQVVQRFCREHLPLR